MVRSNIGFSILLVISAVISIFSLLFSVWIYGFDYSSKLSGLSSSDAEITFFIEASNNSCGDNLCNGAETCSICSEDCGACPINSTSSSSGSSGGGGGGSSTPNFKINKESFNIKIVSGESKDYELLIENIGSSSLNLDVSAIGIEDYIHFDYPSVFVGVGESIPFSFTINAPAPGVYAGKIIFTYQGISRETLILLNVVSEGVLFDAAVSVPDLFRTLRLGQTLPALIEIIPIGESNGVDVNINYLIKDFEGNNYYNETETFYVQGAKSFTKRFSTEGLDPGDYVLGIEVTYPGGTATSTAQFRISSSFFTPQTWVSIIAIFLVIFISLMVLLISKYYRKKKKIYFLKKTLQSSREL